MKHIPYAYEINGRASAIPIALWSASYEHEEGVLGARFAPNFVPIRGAYVACARAPDPSMCGGDTTISKDDVIYGRTNSVGWAVMRDLDKVGAPEDIPDAPKIYSPAPEYWWWRGEDPVTVERSQHVAKDLICGLPNTTHYIFWTYDLSQFQQFADAVEEDAASAFTNWSVPAYCMEPFGHPPAIRGLDLLKEPEHKVVSRLLLCGTRNGYHAGWYFKDKSTAAIFDVTPPALRALYTCEWLEWYTAHLRAEESWRSLATALHVSAVAEQGGKVAQFEDEARSYMVDKIARNDDGFQAGERDWRGFWDYGRYAYECAKACAKLTREQQKDLRDLFIEALAVGQERGEWVDAADEIRTLHGVDHPGHNAAFKRDRDIILDGDRAWDPFIAYFDFYIAGLRYKHDGTVATIHAAQGAVDQAFGWIEQHRLRLLRSHVDFDRLMVSIAQTVPPDQLEHAQKLHDRFTRQCAVLRYAWWEEADQKYLATQTQWAALKQRAGWLGNTGNGVGSLLGSFVQSHVLVHKHSEESARAAVRFCLRLDRWLATGLVDAVEVPRGNGQVVLSLKGEKVHVTIEVLDKSRVQVTGRIAGGSYRGLKQVPSQTPTKGVTMAKVNAADLDARRLKVVLAVDPEAVEKLEGPSKNVGNLANLLNASLAVLKLLEMPEQDLHFFSNRDVQSATWSIMQGVGSTAQVMQSILSTKESAYISKRAMTWAGGVGAVGLAMESAYTLHEGATTLYSGESNAVKRLDQGDKVGATLEMVKGVGQVAAGLGGLGGAVGAGAEAIAIWSSLSVAAGPFSLVFAGGALLVIAMEVSIYSRAGAENRVEPLIDRVRKALNSELHLDARGRSAVQGAAKAPRLRLRLGVLNALLNSQLPANPAAAAACESADAEQSS
jgi:hypothetical protein